MIINNVKLVLENEVVHGSLEMQDGEIRAFAESQSHLSEAMDGEGGWLLPIIWINSSPRARKLTGQPTRR